MVKILYYLIVKPVSLLPHFVLYRISDLLYSIIYYIIGYRKKVVFENLKNSFPNKSENERKQIGKKFYQHFCDLLIESIKTFSLTEKELRRRCKIRNPELLQHYFDQGRSIIVPAGHYNNWELAATASHCQIAHQSVGIYTPMQNKAANQLLYESRNKFGLELVTVAELKNYLASNKSLPIALLFGSDQSPRRSHLAYWTTFLNQEAGVMMGSEIYAKKYDMPVLFGKVIKTKRGFYEFEFSLITEKPKEIKPGEITQAHTRILENIIKEKPEFWLWSHRRWKRKRPKTSPLN